MEVSGRIKRYFYLAAKEATSSEMKYTSPSDIDYNFYLFIYLFYFHLRSSKKITWCVRLIA
jgi:hypothetical protein